MNSKAAYFVNPGYEDYHDKPTTSEQQKRQTMNENRVESSHKNTTQRSNCLLIFLVFIVCIISIAVLILTLLMFRKIGDDCNCTGNEGSSSTSPQKFVGSSAEINDLGNNLTSLQLALIKKVESDFMNFTSHFEKTSKELAEINSTMLRKMDKIESGISDLKSHLAATEKGIENLNSAFIEKMDILDSSISELKSNSTETNKYLEKLNNTLITKMDNFNSSFTGLNDLLTEMNKDLEQLSNTTGQVYAWQIQCENGGTVTLRQIDNGTAFRFVCDCASGFRGERCETGWFSNLSAIILDNAFYRSHLHEFLTPAVGSNPQLRLCYRASIDGWAASTFHTKCDGKNHTVTIIKVEQFVFGGYTDIPWDSTSTFGSTPNAFIFSLSNKEGLGPFKSNVTDQSKAIFRGEFTGPTFGADIEIANDADTQASSTNFGDSYFVPDGVQDNLTILAGTQNFTPDEVEVFFLG